MRAAAFASARIGLPLAVRKRPRLHFRAACFNRFTGFGCSVRLVQRHEAAGHTLHQCVARVLSCGERLELVVSQRAESNLD